MAVTVRDLTGRSAQINESSSATWTLAAIGATNEHEASVAVFSYLTGLYGTPPTITLGARTLHLKTITPTERTRDGWLCSIEWGMFQVKEPLQQGESSFSFEIGVAPIRVVVPIGSQTVYKHASDTESTPVFSLIGDQGLPDHEPAGVEVYEPVHTESETHILPASSITPTYKAAVKAVVGRTNAGTFKGHAAGECLLQSVSGQKRGSADWEVSFRWGVRDNQSGLTIAGITGISKQGWQYLWPRYFIGKDSAGANILTRQIRYIVVSTVFRSGDYSALGIGTT